MSKLIKVVIPFIILFAAPLLVTAQITINQESNTESRPLELRPDQRFVSPEITPPYYRTHAMRRLDRIHRRQERNTFEVKFNVTANQTYYDNWAKGGSNFLNINSTFWARHIYKKEKLSLTTYLDTGLGYNFLDTTRFKNADKLILDFAASWNISNAWSYSGQVRGETQFLNGYKNADDDVLRSTFMAPGKVTIAFGFTYAPKNSGLKASISPIGGQLLFVLNDELSEQGLNGITPGKHFKATLGSNGQVEFNRTFGRNDQVNYRTTATAFYDYKIPPQVTWTNTLTIQATKLLATTVKWDLIYDQGVTSGLRDGEYLQTKYEIGVGFLLNYNSKNKK